jgi:hypothetical protein
LSQITPQTGLQSDSNPFVTRYQRPRNIFQHYENIFNRISEQISERLGRSTVTRVDIAMPGNNHLNPHDQQINEAIQGLGQMSEEIRAIRNQPMTIQQLMKYLVDILDTIHTMSVEIMLAAARSLGVEQSVVGFLNMIQTFYNGAETFFKGIIILGVGAGFCYVTLKTTRFGLRIITNYIFPMGSNIRFELYATWYELRAIGNGIHSGIIGPIQGALRQISFNWIRNNVLTRLTTINVPNNDSTIFISQTPNIDDISDWTGFLNTQTQRRVHNQGTQLFKRPNFGAFPHRRISTIIKVDNQPKNSDTSKQNTRLSFYKNFLWTNKFLLFGTFCQLSGLMYLLYYENSFFIFKEIMPLQFGEITIHLTFKLIIFFYFLLNLVLLLSPLICWIPNFPFLSKLIARLIYSIGQIKIASDFLTQLVMVTIKHGQNFLDPINKVIFLKEYLQKLNTTTIFQTNYFELTLNLTKNEKLNIISAWSWEQIEKLKNLYPELSINKFQIFLNQKLKLIEQNDLQLEQIFSNPCGIIQSIETNIVGPFLQINPIKTVETMTYWTLYNDIYNYVITHPKQVVLGSIIFTAGVLCLWYFVYNNKINLLCDKTEQISNNAQKGITGLYNKQTHFEETIKETIVKMFEELKKQNQGPITTIGIDEATQLKIIEATILSLVSNSNNYNDLLTILSYLWNPTKTTYVPIELNPITGRFNQVKSLYTLEAETFYQDYIVPFKEKYPKIAGSITIIFEKLAMESENSENK